MSVDVPLHDRSLKVPSAQHISRGSTLRVEDVNRQELFDVCTDGVACVDSETTGTCLTGAFAPCCLLGAATKMRKNGFTEEVGPCDGCGSVCCGIYSFNVFFGGSFLGPLVGSFLAVKCVAMYEEERLSDYLKYIFCLPCGACADYSSAITQVYVNKNM